MMPMRRFSAAAISLSPPLGPRSSWGSTCLFHPSTTVSMVRFPAVSIRHCAVSRANSVSSVLQLEVAYRSRLMPYAI